jgi:ABC-type amino acid transport substrate-binding protein/mono/diheme cytochrome c family protein
LAWLAGVVPLLYPFPGQYAAAIEEASKPLRLCVDRSNLPFTSADPKTPGLYVEIGEAIGRAMGYSVAPVWNLTYFGKRALRITLLAAKCDAAIGLPRDAEFMGPRVIFSKPLLQIGYALVVPNSMAIASLDDLKGRRVAVQFSTTPQNLIADRDDIQTATFREPEEAMQALAAGHVDVAFIWGPIAGFINKAKLNDAYRVVPVDGPGLQWQAAIGFARGQTALREEVDHGIDRVASEIGALEIKYGFPTESPITLAQGGAAPDKQQAVEAPPSVGESAEIAAGRELFNETCAHCHGPEAVAAERRVNLRLMQRRYRDKMDEVFMTTVMNGRPDKGMPDWSGAFNNDAFTKILSFLHSVQTR